MRTKFESIIVVSIILLSILFVNWDFNLDATNFDGELPNASTSRFQNRFNNRDFTWSNIEVISEHIMGQNHNTGESYSPKIAVEDDKIYVVWVDDSNYNGHGVNYDIFYRYFDGSKWTDIQVISEPVFGQNFNIERASGPKLAVDNGKIYVVWYSQNDTNGAGLDYDILFRCNLTGKGWENIQVISEPIQGQDLNIRDSLNPEIAVENGKIYVVWQDKNNTNGAGSDNDIFFRCNLTSTHWEPTQVISEPVFNQNFNTEYSSVPNIAVENGNIYVVWEDENNTNNAGLDYDIFYRCNITGYNWEPIQIISEPVPGQNLNMGISEKSCITVENGRIFIVWDDENNSNGAGTDYDIFYRCNITGYNWEPTQVISEPVPGQNFNIEESGYSEVMVENDNIYVIWMDYWEENANILFRCNLTGSYWEPIQVISKPQVDGNLSPGKSWYGNLYINNRNLHVVWQDLNNTNGAGIDYDIFYRYVSLSIIFSQPKITPISGNTSTYFNFTTKYIHLENIAPIKIIVNISGREYPISEVDPIDISYSNGKDYFCNITNLNIGTNTFYFSAFDGVKIKCSNIFDKPLIFNTPPKIKTNNNLTAFEDTYYEVDYDYEDRDLLNVDQPGFWNFSTNANWLKFNYSTGVLNGIPTNDDVGKYSVYIMINDTMSMDSTNFIITVEGVNDPPTILTKDVTFAIEDKFYEVVYNAEDIDNVQTDLVWTIDTDAEWLAFNTKTAIVSGTPINENVGEYWVNISVSDTKDIDFTNFTLEVLNVNDPPKIITTDIPNAIEDKYFVFKFEAEDVDNTKIELTWNFNTNAKWLRYNTSNTTIYGIPINDNVGKYFVNVSITDNEYIDYFNYTLTVLNSNDPPKIISNDVLYAIVDQLYSVNYEVEDIDPPPISFKWFLRTNTSNWLFIDSVTGWLTGIPSVDDVGTYWVNISVTDNENGWDFHNFTLQILKTPSQKNHSPQLYNASISPSEGDIKTEFTFSVRYYDADGDVPVFIQVVIDGRVYTLKLKSGENAADGVYEYSTILSEGTHLYYFTAFDGSESVKTNNLTTPDIKDIDKISTEEISWYWLFLIVIIIIIIAVLTLTLLLKKRKAMKLPTVQAEMLRATPEHIALPTATPSTDIATTLAAQPIVSKQLPTPRIQVQLSEAIPSETISIPSLAPAPIQPQYQLPQVTLTTAQELHLLRERFLKGEVTEETYKKLRAEIEAHTGEDITKDDSEEQPGISEPQQPGTTEQPTLEKIIPASTPELVGKPPSPEQTPKVETQQPQVPESQTSVQDLESEKSELKDHTDEE